MGWTKRPHGGRLLMSLAAVLLAVGLVATGPASPAVAAPAPAAVAPAPAMVVTPAIADQPCTAARSQWVHVYTQSVGTFCLGGMGTWIFNGGNGRWITKITFGNNYGHMHYSFNTETDGTVQAYENFDGKDPYANELDCTQWPGNCRMDDLTIVNWH